MNSKKIKIRTFASGNSSFVRAYEFKGSSPNAKSAYIQSSIHGAELQGNSVIHALIEHFKLHPPEGTVVLVPCANPHAMDRKVGEYTDGRFDPTTGENWNRAYFMPIIERESDRSDPAQWCMDETKKWSMREAKAKIAAGLNEKRSSGLRFSQQLSLCLQTMASRADLVLDLHCANVSVPHLYTANCNLKDAQYLGFAHLISIPRVFAGALDEAICAPWAILQKKFNLDVSQLPQSYTLELGNQESVSFEKGKKQAAQIINFLKHQGTVKGRANKTSSAFVCDLKDYETIHAPRGGLYEYPLELGKLARGQSTLARCLSFNSGGSSLLELKLKKSVIPILRYSSGAVNEGDELFKVFGQWRSI